MPKRSGLALLAFALSFSAVFVFANRYLAASKLPNYGTWTGVRTLEEKFRLFDAFAAEGPVDMLVLGSSFADWGVSAQILTARLSKAAGHPVRVFNFGSGAAGFEAFPILYRIARLTTKPKTLLIAIPGTPMYGENAPPSSPETTMYKAPIGKALGDDRLLALSAKFWQLPISQSASAARDFLFFGQYTNRKISNADFIPFDPYGDTISYTFDRNRKELKGLIAKREQEMIEAEARYEAAMDPEKWHAYLSRRHYAAIRELRALTQVDGCSIVLVRHDEVVGYLSTNPTYLKAIRPFFAEVAKDLGASAVIIPEDFIPEPYEFGDFWHLNVHGAAAYTNYLASLLLKEQVPTRIGYRYLEFETFPASQDIGAYPALVLRAGAEAENKVLHLNYMETWATQAIAPSGDLWVALRDWENKDLIALAARQPDGSIVARFEDLPGGSQAFIARLLYQTPGGRVAYNTPLGQYHWVKD